MVAAVMMVCGTGAAIGQAYPSKTLRMLTAELGGGSDLSTRLIALASSPEELAVTMKSEMTRMGKVIKAAGIKVE